MEDYSQLYENNIKMLNHAIECCNEPLSHEDLINELASDNDIKKQLCIIEIKELKSQHEADLLVYNLTEKSTPVRELTSYKILELIKNPDYSGFFQSNKILDTFTLAITDINPAISRNTTEIIKYIKNTDYLAKNIINALNITLNSMQDIKQNHSYIANKKNFNLYWNLEALTVLADKIEVDEDIISIIETTYKSNDYTVREKTAKLISYLKSEYFNNITEILKNDDNIYVRKYFSDYDII